MSDEPGASPSKTWGYSCIRTNCDPEEAIASNSLQPMDTSHPTLVTREHNWNSRPGESSGQEEQATEGADLGNWKQSCIKSWWMLVLGQKPLCNQFYPGSDQSWCRIKLTLTTETRAQSIGPKSLFILHYKDPVNSCELSPSEG